MEFLDIIREIQSLLFAKDWVNSLLINKTWYSAHDPIDRIRRKYDHKKRVYKTKMLKDHNVPFWDSDKTEVKHAMILGPSGSSKTRMSAHLANILSNKNHRVHYLTSCEDRRNIQRFDISVFTEMMYNKNSIADCLDWIKDMIRIKDSSSKVMDYIFIDRITMKYSDEIMDIIQKGEKLGIYFIFVQSYYTFLPMKIRSRLSQLFFLHNYTNSPRDIKMIYHENFESSFEHPKHLYAMETTAGSCDRGMMVCDNTRVTWYSLFTGLDIKSQKDVKNLMQ